ncbi:MAG: M23 family metallopeptidase [Muribaculaceae bacterium]|nr:M23 family metallopeptidase [Muribaculaceae bacterium]
MAHKRDKIRIRIEHESHLSTITDTRLSLWAIAGILFLIIILSLFSGCLIVLLTPLHTLLPGYLKETQRSATEENLMRLDSLRNVYETNQRYIDNFLRVTDIERLPSDSVALKEDSVISSHDTLLPPSERERRFVARMEEQEKFNISVLAPLAADGMTFSPISDTGIFSNASKDSETGEILLPADASVLSVADGTVLAAFFSRAENGYVTVIQHQRGFASRYSHLGKPLVVMGEDVSAGQIIASPPPPDRSGKRYIYIMMWHNGLPVLPYKFINERESGNFKELFGIENSFEAPRGK